jgi:hypothetical protein
MDGSFKILGIEGTSRKRCKAADIPFNVTTHQPFKLEFLLRQLFIRRTDVNRH